MRYQLVVFDLDGTLADTSAGIVNSHRYAHKMMGIPEPTLDELESVIGGPLLETYQDRFGLSEADARRAVSFYRSYYAKKGIYEASLYPGISETLQHLCVRGMKLGVATLKAERFAHELLGRLGVKQFFSVIYGMDEKDSRTKADLIQLCMESVCAAPENTVLVGDSVHDWDGAATCGVSFLGVAYGFGFSSKEVYDIPMAYSPEEVATYILQQ